MSRTGSSVLGGAALGVLTLCTPLHAQAPSMSFVGTSQAPSLGRSVCGVGDISGDGVDDLAVGVSNGGWGGHVRVFSGATGAVLMDWAVVDGFVTTGASMKRIRDADGDGVGDIVVGSRDDHPDGAFWDVVTIFSGADGSPLMQKLQVCGPMDQPQVSGAGDVDGDGLEDVVLGDMGFFGESFVLSGADGQVLLQIDDVGHSVSELGDHDGDGTPDLLIGGRASPTDPSRVVRVHSGATGAPLLVVGPTPIADAFARSMDLLADLDGDGLPDFAVGAPQPAVAASAGYVQFRSSGTGALLALVRGDAGDRLGWSLAAAGDVDGDGWSDVVVGAPQSVDGPGKALVLSGLDGSVLRAWAGDALGDRFGESVAAAGDVNQDGFADVIVGSPGAGFGVARVFTGCPGVMAPFGTGCPGSGGYAPMLVMGGCPAPGGQVELQVKRALPHTLALLFAGLPLSPPLTLPSGCGIHVGSPFLLVGALSVEGTSLGEGIGSIGATIPPGLLGTIALQAFVADPAAANGYAGTNGLRLTISPMP